VLGPHGDLQWHIAAEQLTTLRTAAASAVASREIIPPSPTHPDSNSSAGAITIAIFGTGPVAAAHLDAFTRIYPLATFLIVSRVLQVSTRTRAALLGLLTSTHFTHSVRKRSAAAMRISARACRPVTTRRLPPPPPPSSSLQRPPPRPCCHVLIFGAASWSSVLDLFHLLTASAPLLSPTATSPVH
jgi:hypothetical protein